MHLSAFDFDLPEALIATRPVRPRPAARLLVAEAGAIADAHVRDLPALLRPGDRLVVNDTKVIPARLDGVRRRAGAEARVSVTLAEPVPEGGWRVLARPLKRLRPGDTIGFAGGLTAQVTAREAEAAILTFDRTGADFDVALAVAGQMPLPPYIAGRRAADARDAEDYQTVFAAHPGAVAAPTAALHFDEALLAALAAHGVGLSRITLHVGAGTFLPVKTEDVAQHRMHAEWGRIDGPTAAAINAARADGGRVIAVGTTALRVLETAALDDGTLAPWQGETDIFIRPGYRFRAIDGLMTNFHLPRSTLMMLVSALMGIDRIRAIYAHAIAERYRFFSYGDASLLIPPAGSRQDGVADGSEAPGRSR
jgi:S-adenosylmethionine:tRNA ribosyltransferase-isomerase